MLAVRTPVIMWTVNVAGRKSVGRSVGESGRPTVDNLLLQSAVGAPSGTTHTDRIQSHTRIYVSAVDYSYYLNSNTD